MSVGSGRESKNVSGPTLAKESLNPGEGRPGEGTEGADESDDEM